jgi:hypothetical protein
MPLGTVSMTRDSPSMGRAESGRLNRQQWIYLLSTQLELGMNCWYARDLCSENSVHIPRGGRVCGLAASQTAP